MTQTGKIVLILLVVLLLCCACACVLSFAFLGVAGSAMARNVTVDSEKIPAIAAGMAELPTAPGYRPAYGMQFFGFSMVDYDGADGHSHIMLMQAPTSLGMDQAMLERQMQQATDNSQRSEEGLNLHVVGQKEVTIRGQQVTLTQSEGSGSGQRPYREVSCVFQGKGGPVLLVIVGPIDTWDQAVIDVFISNIR